LKKLSGPPLPSPEDRAAGSYEEIAGQGIRALVDGDLILAGNERLMQANGIGYQDESGRDSAAGLVGTKVYVARNGSYLGCIVISDEPKPDAAAAIAALKARGVKRTVMLSGDEPATVEAVGRELGLDEAYGGLLPAEKVAKFEAILSESGENVAFVGDGINDAPVLARAGLGVSMGALGSDAAIEAADVVLMTDEPSRLATAVDAARATRRIVSQNIVLALGIKALVLAFGALGMATMWEAVFADVGAALLAVLNSMRVLRRQQ
jgi:Cd2+/Zn2+-exporting ATPase